MQQENPQLNTEQQDNKTEPDNEQDIAIESGSSSVSHQDFTKPDLSNNFMSHLDELLQQDNGFDNYSTTVQNQKHNETNSQVLVQNTKQTITYPKTNKPVAKSPDLSHYNALAKPSVIKATSELQFLHWRVIVSRMLQRVNIEDTNTGERCSITLDYGVFSSDWKYSQFDEEFIFAAIPLVVTVTDKAVVLRHVEHGVELTVGF